MRQTVAAAALLTAVVTFLVYLVAGLVGARHPDWVAGISALVFFAFCSAATLWRYWRREVVVAMRPDGLFDARLGPQAVPWDDIKELVVHRSENDYGIEVVPWPGVETGWSDGRVDLAGLDAPPGTVVGALPVGIAIRMERTG